MKREDINAVALTILMGCIFAVQLAGPILGNKIANVMGATFAMGAVTAAIGYALLDVLNDLWGKDQARRTAWAVVIVRSLFYFVLIPFVLLFPVDSQIEGFEDFFMQAQRIQVASLVAYGVGVAIVNVSLFSWLKDKMNGKNFVLRYLIVTAPVILLNQVLSTTISFWGTGKDLVALIIGALLVRYVASIILAPFAGLLRAGLSRVI